jgi:predicted Zn-dependent peptidase
MVTRGTSSLSKTELAEKLESLGAVYSDSLEREQTSFNLQVFKSDTGSAVKLLGDMLSNAVLNSAELELAKEEVSQEHEANHTRYQETLLENVHYNAFREHMLGQPVKGDRDNTSALLVDQLREYHTANYVGDNIVVVATGDVTHE